MPGKILSVAVSAGQAVKKGETLLILEAMKMQNEIAAPHDAVVAEVRVAAITKLYPLAMIWLFLANTKCCLMARLRRVI